MTADVASGGSGERARTRRTRLYTLTAWLILLTLSIATAFEQRLSASWWDIAILLALTSAGYVITEDLEGDFRFASSTILVLAAIGIYGPLEASLVAAVGPLVQPRMRLDAKLFNSGMFATAALVGGHVYAWTGGSHMAHQMLSPGGVARHTAVPLLAANLVMMVVNAVLLAGIVRVADGVPMRYQVSRLLLGTGLPYLGHTAQALLLVILWLPVGLGWVAALLIMPTLIGAIWSSHQHDVEHRAHETAIEVLVAAFETKVPHLTGHSARVATLASTTAQELGLGPHEVTAVRRAALLHPVRQLALPNGAALTAAAPGACGGGSGGGDHYPQRTVELLSGLSFLHESATIIEEHEQTCGLAVDEPHASLGARILQVSDAYDMLVNPPDAEGLAPAEALEVVRARFGEAAAVVADGLTRAVRRERGGQQ